MAVVLFEEASLRTRVGSCGRYTPTSAASSMSPRPALTPLARICSVVDDKKSGNPALLPPAVTIP